MTVDITLTLLVYWLIPLPNLLGEIGKTNTHTGQSYRTGFSICCDLEFSTKEIPQMS